MRWWRFPIHGIGLLLWAALSLVASLVFHIDSQPARVALRDTLDGHISNLLAGELHFSQVDKLSLSHAELSGVFVYDANGNQVIAADKVRVDFDLSGILGGEVFFGPAEIEGGSIELLNDESGLPTFIGAFLPAEPSDDEESSSDFRVLVSNIALRNFEVRGDVMAVSGIVAESVDLNLSMEFVGSAFQVDIKEGSGKMTKPFDLPAPVFFEGVRATIRNSGAEVVAHAKMGNEAADASFRYQWDEPTHMELKVAALPLSAQTVAAIGFDWADILTGRFRGDVSLSGNETLTLDATLDSDAGEIAVEGKIPSEGETRIFVRSNSLELDKVMTSSPPIKTSAELAVVIPQDGSKVALEAALGRFDFNGFDVPPTRTLVEIKDGKLSLESVELAGLKRALRVNGDIGNDGDFRFALHLDLPDVAMERNVRSMIPGLHAGLKVDGFLLRKNGDAPIELDGEFVFRNLRYGYVRIDEVRAKGAMDLNLWPRLDLSGRVRGARVGSRLLGSGPLRVAGNPQQYRGQILLIGERNARSEIEIVGKKEGNAFSFDMPRWQVVGPKSTWSGIARGMQVARKQIQVEEFFADVDGGSVRVAGVWRPAGHDSLDFKVRELKLERLAWFVPEEFREEVRGVLNGELSISGDLEVKPVIAGHASLRAAQLGPLMIESWRGIGEYHEGEASMSGVVTLEGGGTAKMDLKGLVDTEAANTIEALQYGVYELDIEGSGLPLALASKLGASVDADGDIDIEVHASGPIDAPTFRGQMMSKSFRVAGVENLDANLSFAYEYGALNTVFRLNDLLGELFEIETSLLVDLVELVRHPKVTTETFTSLPWRVAARIPPRQLAQIPPPFPANLASLLAGMRLAASFSASGGSMPVHAELVASGEFEGGLASSDCARGARPRWNLNASLADADVRGHLAAFAEDKAIMKGTFDFQAPVETWFVDPSSFFLPAIAAHVEANIEKLESLPFVCEKLSGELHGDLKISDYLGDNPGIEARVGTRALRMRKLLKSVGGDHTKTASLSPPLTFDAHTKVSENQVSAKVDGRWEGGKITALGSLPLTWPSKAVIPTVGGDEPLSGDIDVEGLALGLLLDWMPDIRDAAGVLSGKLAIAGNVNEPRLNGRLELEDGRLVISSLGQRLRRMRGGIVFDGTRIRLDELVAHEHGGEAHLNGDIMLERWRPKSAKIQMHAEAFPFRKEGSVVARVTGDGDMAVGFEPDAMKAKLNMEKLAVRVADELAGSPQELRGHPDIRVLGTNEESDAVDGDYVLDLQVDADQPFWIRRKDGAAQAKANIRVVYEAPDIKVGGEVALRRGYFEVFGKRFNVDRGHLGFDGGANIDPTVSLVATHFLGGDESKTVSVQVGGRLSNLSIKFQSTESNEQSEILSLLISGDTQADRALSGGSEASAEAQAANFVAGIAAGALTLTLREQLGDIVPDVRVEASSSGAAVHFGKDFSWLVPEFLSSFVRGVYVQGYYKNNTNSGDNSSTDTQHDGGFLIELQFPYDLIGTGSWNPASWSLDLTYEP